jgi:hypothetical protein
MFKKVTSIEEISQDDLLYNGPNPETVKEYQIKNIGIGHVYAIREDGSIDLKVITSHSLMVENWWRKER